MLDHHQIGASGVDLNVDRIGNLSLSLEETFEFDNSISSQRNPAGFPAADQHNRC